MLCDECGKNPASIHIVQITTEGKSARNLCQRCAAKLGADVSSLDNIGGLEGNFTVNDFLRGVFGGSHSRKIESKDSLENEENLSRNFFSEMIDAVKNNGAPSIVKAPPLFFVNS